MGRTPDRPIRAHQRMPDVGRMKSLLAMATTALLASVVFVVIPARVAYATSSTLASGGTLGPGQSLTSPSGQYALNMQTDGNLVEYIEYSGGQSALWSSGTQGNGGAHVTMQTDGNLVVYSTSGVALWNSQTSGHPGDYLSLQSDANLVIYGSGGALWADWAQASILASQGSLTGGQYLISTNNEYALVMQTDGNLVEDVWGQPEWWTGTSGNPGAYVTMQGDENLVVYSSNGTALWNSQTGGHAHGSYYVAVLLNGSLFIY